MSSSRVRRQREEREREEGREGVMLFGWRLFARGREKRR